MGALSILKNQAEQQHESFWFYVKNESSYGPFSHSEIESFISEGKLSSGDFCWRQGFDEWRSFSSTQEFSDKFSPQQAAILYPKIDVPSKLELSIVSDLQKKEESTRKKVTVQLAKSKKYYFSLYEWTIALLFSIGLAYLSVTFALNEVRKGFLVKTLQSQMGVIHFLGELNSSGEISTKHLNPLFSAPGAMDYPFSLPVDLVDYPREHNKGEKSFVVGDYTVQSQESLLQKHEFIDHIDPVYHHPYEVHGELFLNRPREILVNNPGSPLVFSH